MHRIETVTVQDSPMEVFMFEPEGEGPHPGLVLAQHIPVGHTGDENDTFTLKTAERFAETSFFPDIDLDVLTATIQFYQGLGCWAPHVEITKAAYEVTLDVFEHVGRLNKRHAYEDVCVPPPAE